MAVGRLFFLSLVFSLDSRRFGVQAQQNPVLLWRGDGKTLPQDLASLAEYKDVVIGGGPVSIGFKATYTTVSSSSPDTILSFDTGSGNDRIEVFSSANGLQLIYRTSTNVQVPRGKFTITPGSTHTFLLTIANDGTVSVFYKDATVDQIYNTPTADAALVPAAVKRTRMVIGADAARSSTTFDGSIDWVVIFNSIVTWDEMNMALIPKQVAFTLHIQTSNEANADTQSGADVSFALENSNTPWEVFAERASFNQVKSKSFNLESWPKALLVTSRASAPVKDSWGLREISITMDSGGARFVVLAPGNLTFSPDSEYWIDNLVGDSNVGAQRYEIPALGCNALEGISFAPAVTCVEGGFILHGEKCTTRCLAGYTPSASELICEFGTFSIGSYVCDESPCDQQVTAPANGNLGNCPSTPLSSGQSCQPGCDAKYYLQSDTHCERGVLYLGVCLGNPCDISNLPAHALRGTCPMELASGASCQLVCDYGYTGGAVSCSLGDTNLQPCLVTFTIEVETSTEPFSETSVGADIDFMLADGWSNEQVMCENANSGELVSKTFADMKDWPTALRIKGKGTDYWGFLDRHIWIVFEGHRQSLRVCDRTATYPYLRIASGTELDSYDVAMFKLPCLYCVPPVGIINAAEIACVEGASIGHGGSCTAKCAAGYVPSVSTLDCALDALIPPTFTCSEMPCMTIQPPLNGDMGSCESQIESGTSCSFSCNDGYTLSATSFCLLGSLSEAYCEPSSCVVTAPANGQLGDCPSTLAHGASCTHSCDQGYSVLQDTSCAFGKLTSICNPNPCGSVTPPANGSLGDCPQELKSGSSCQPQCDAGYDISGRSSCSLGILSVAMCMPSPCLLPTSIANGSVGDCGDLDPTTRNRLLSSGHQCDMVCNPGYRLLSGKTTCLRGQLTLVGCTPADCALMLPENADMGNCPLTLRSGESCQPICRMGYNPVGALLLSRSVLSRSASLSCFAGALTKMQCYPDACDTSTAPANGARGDCPATLLSNTTCQPTCQDGYLVSGRSLCLSGQLFEATCRPLPCDMQVPGNGTQGDCPDVLQSGSMCAPRCNFGYAPTGNTTCNAATLRPAACIPRSCEFFELPANSISYGDCRQTLESGRSCRPICANGFNLHLEFACDRGTLQLAECKEAPGIDIQERLLNDDALPYAIGCAIALLFLLGIVIATLCWCQRERLTKPHVDIESLQEHNQSIAQLRRGIDEAQLTLSRPPILGSEAVGEEDIPSATRALTLMPDEDHVFGGVQRVEARDAIIEPILRTQYEEGGALYGYEEDAVDHGEIRNGAVRTASSPRFMRTIQEPRHEYEEETIDYGNRRNLGNEGRTIRSRADRMATPPRRVLMRPVTPPRHVYEQEAVDHGDIRRHGNEAVDYGDVRRHGNDAGAVRNGVVRTVTSPRHMYEDGRVRQGGMRTEISTGDESDDRTMRRGVSLRGISPNHRGNMRMMTSPRYQQFSPASYRVEKESQNVLNTDDIRVDIP